METDFEKDPKQAILRANGSDLGISVTQLTFRGDVNSFRVTEKNRKSFDGLGLKYWDEVEIYVGTEQNPQPKEFIQYIYCGFMRFGVDNPKKVYGVRKVE